MSLTLERPWLRRALIFVLIALLALAALPQIWNPFSRDHGELTACAQALLRGAALYRDCWENKGPLTYPFYMLPIALSPTILAVRLFDVIWQALTTLVLGRAIAHMSGQNQTGTLAAAVYWALYMGSGFWNTAQSETFAALFIVLCAYGLWRGTSRWLFIAGLCAGVFIWIKYTYALIALGMGVVMLWQHYRTRIHADPNGLLIKPNLIQLKSAFIRQIRVLVPYLAGALVVTTIVLAYLALSGAFPAFLRHLYFLQGPFAVRHDWATTLDLAGLALRNYINDGAHIGPVAKPTVPIWNVAGFGFPILCVLALYGLRDIRRNPAVGYWVVAWLCGFIGIVWQGRYAAYHSMLLLAPLVASASFALRRSQSAIAPPPSWGGAGGGATDQADNDISLSRFALVCALIAALIGCIPGVLDWHSNVIVQGKTPRQVYDDTSMHDELLLSDWLQTHSAPQDRIAIWGIAANVYFVSQRQNATAFNFILPFEYDSLYRNDWMQQYVAQMQANQPKYVIVSKDDYPTPGSSAQRTLQNAAPIHDYIEQHYRYIGESTVFLLYERNHE